jgi:hypothetical protein
MRVLTVGCALFLDFIYKLTNLLYKIIFSPPSTLCALNFFENRSSPRTLLIEENIISAIHLLPASLIEFTLKDLQEPLESFLEALPVLNNELNRRWR